MNFLSIKNFSIIQRRFLLVIIDFVLVFVSQILFSEIFINFTETFFFSNLYFYVLFLSFFGLILYAITGQYKSLTRYATSKTIYNLAFRNFVFVLSILVISKILNVEILFSNVIVILWLVLTFTTGGTRFVLRDFIYFLNKNNISNSSTNAIIYGAGEAGVALLLSLKNKNFKNIVCFIDDNKDLWGSYISGIPIRSPDSLANMQNISKTIYLAIPSLTKDQYKNIFSKISKLGFEILKVPSLYEIASGKITINELRPLNIEDILGRDEVSPNYELLEESIKGKTILITGAGGTIGSELSKQILNIFPKKIILLEMSEPALHNLSRQFYDYSPDFKNVEFILGNACNEKLIEKIFEQNKVDVVFHAAAYKHVPLVEINPSIGILNNVLSTKNLCKLSFENKIEKFVLISSDKAVRPTSIMGASKRVCELIVQSFAFKSKNDSKMNGKESTKFSFVRFGNVLRSSGSVVPIFEEQIKKGGPLLVTHPEINRYFMSIEEAASLVIQAAALSKGGEIFLLDMGDPIKIVDLAKQMINLSGYKVKDKNNLSGDIEIKFTGLRKGEKLYEELLIEKNSKKTKHPLIFESFEKSKNYLIINTKIEALIDNLLDLKNKESLKFLSEIVPEWKTPK